MPSGKVEGGSLPLQYFSHCHHSMVSIPFLLNLTSHHVDFSRLGLKFEPLFVYFTALYYY
jgi:hypothetical protein